MNIGVICEGPSDFPAVTCFFGHALQQRGISARFRALFPEMDRTRPEGGWANVLLWLKSHPPAYRVQQYFGGGLFGGAMSTEPLDAILIQLDADVIEDASFIVYAKNTYGYDVVLSNKSEDRAEQIVKIIELASAYTEMTAADVARHVATPAVEATETWCLAAFHSQPQDFENLRGAELTNAFMDALERSEGRAPEDAYQNVDKNARRRKNFCMKHAAGSERIVASCRQFSTALEALVALN